MTSGYHFAELIGTDPWSSSHRTTIHKTFPPNSWGHDFRPAYRRLSYLRTQFPNVPCLACTATATPQVVQDIQLILKLQKAPLLLGSFDRPNIFYKVKYKDAIGIGMKGGSNTGGGGGALSDMVQWSVQQHSKCQRRNELCSGIIYVHKRDDTTHIARSIQRHAQQQRLPLRAEPYHAGLNKGDRERVLREWSTDQIQVAVATVAFGMGIDLPHVRYVIHWSMAKTVEGFYQESGRAGRDGLPSHSILYYSPDDVSKFQYLIRMQAEQQQRNKKVRDGNASDADDDKNCERKLNALEQMVQYCTQPACRRNALIRHFGGTSVECKQTCDYCRNPDTVKRTIQSASIMGDVFGRTQGRNWNRKGTKTDEDKKLLAWDNNHGLSVEDMDDEERIAQDWGDGMVGDLRVTDAGDRSSFRKTSGLGGHGGFVKASSLTSSNFNSTKGKGPFVKASDVLERYSKMEERYSEGGEEVARSTMVPIPDHFQLPRSRRRMPSPKIPS